MKIETRVLRSFSSVPTSIFEVMNMPLLRNFSSKELNKEIEKLIKAGRLHKRRSSPVYKYYI